jgi:hypothetical protein
MYYALMNSGGYGSTISANTGDGAAILVPSDFSNTFIYRSPQKLRLWEDAPASA